MITFGIKEAACATASIKNMIQNYLTTRLIQFLSLVKSNAAPPI